MFFEVQNRVCIGIYCLLCSRSPGPCQISNSHANCASSRKEEAIKSGVTMGSKVQGEPEEGSSSDATSPFILPAKSNSSTEEEVTGENKEEEKSVPDFGFAAPATLNSGGGFVFGAKPLREQPEGMGDTSEVFKTNAKSFRNSTKPKFGDRAVIKDNGEQCRANKASMLSLDTPDSSPNKSGSDIAVSSQMSTNRGEYLKENAAWTEPSAASSPSLTPSPENRQRTPRATPSPSPEPSPELPNLRLNIPPTRFSGVSPSPEPRSPDVPRYHHAHPMFSPPIGDSWGSPPPREANLGVIHSGSNGWMDPPMSVTGQLSRNEPRPQNLRHMSMPPRFPEERVRSMRQVSVPPRFADYHGPSYLRPTVASEVGALFCSMLYQP